MNPSAHIRLCGRAGNQPVLELNDAGEVFCRLLLEVKQQLPAFPKAGPGFDAQWHEVIATGQLAQLICAQIKPGCALTIEGSLYLRIATDNEGTQHVVCTTWAKSFEPLFSTAAA